LAKKKRKHATKTTKSSAKRAIEHWSGPLPVFPRPLTSVDLAIFTVREDDLCVLLLKRELKPYRGVQALPGGFVDIDHDEDLLVCAKRKLLEKTGVEANYLEQVGSWGNATRDPRGWSTTHVYFALIPVIPTKDLDESSHWLKVKNITKADELAFDHHKLLTAAVERLRSKVEYTSLPAYLLEAPFTMPQLQRTYEIVLDRAIDKSSFRTRTLSADYLAETGLLKVDAPRPAMGYKIKPGHEVVFFPRPFNPR
jgi:8-oxo-dGTP diphosphatase